MPAATTALAGLLPGLPLNGADAAGGALLAARRPLAGSAVAAAANPVVTSVSLPRAGTYGADSSLTFRLNFDQRVFVKDQQLVLPVEMDYWMANAEYVRGSGTRSLVFKLKVPAEELAPNGIDVGIVSSVTGVRDFAFADGSVVNKAGDSAANTIPQLNTSRIRIDSVGPQITGSSDLQVSGQRVALKVIFDRPVIVRGRPTIPVLVNGEEKLLTLSGGNWTKTLTFTLRTPGTTVDSATFRPYTGDVIYLPDNVGIRDRLGNQIYVLESGLASVNGNYVGGETLIENGNRVVVIGQHFEALRSLTADELNSKVYGVGLNPDYPDLQAKVALFYGIGAVAFPPGYPSNEQGYYGPWFPDTPNPQPWPFLNDYQFTPLATPTHGVDLYRVAFRSSIPEQQRVTTAYGIAAIPTDATGTVSVVESQQPTVFDMLVSAPSQAFDCLMRECSETEKNRQLENDVPRFTIAQFGGQGYAVFIPDPFGLGNSVERYAFQIKGSSAQWSTDMYNAGMKLLQARNLQADDVFLHGWSAGGNESANFLEKLESEGKTVSGMAVASSPIALGPAVRTAVFYPRDWTEQSTGDAVWLNVGTAFTSFSQGGYEGQPNSAINTLGKNYEASRLLYTQQTPVPAGFGPAPPSCPEGDEGCLGGGLVTVYPFNTKFDPDTGKPMTQPLYLPYPLTQLIVPETVASQAAYDQSSYAKLMMANGAGIVPWLSPVLMVYGSQDEVLSVPVGKSVYDWQVDAYQKQNIAFDVTNAANHRGNYLAALNKDLVWFDSINAQP